MSAVRVARPVSSSTGEAPQSILAFLAGRVKAIIGSQGGYPKALGDIRWSYKKEPADRVMLVEIRAHEGVSTAARLFATVSLNGSATKLAGTTDRLSGATSLACASSRIRAAPLIQCFIDLSGLTDGTTYDLLVTTSSAAGVAQGIHSLTAYTVPRPLLDPENNPSTDGGVQWNYPRGDNPIYAGSASTAADLGGGTERYIYELDQWRTKSVRYPLQIATLESDTYAWSTASAAFANLSGLSSAAFGCRVQRFYTTATKGKYSARIRYKVTGGGTAVLRITSTTVGAATVDNNDSAGLAGAAYGWSAAFAVNMATDGTLQETLLTIQGKTTAGTFYVDSIVVYPAET